MQRNAKTGRSRAGRALCWMSALLPLVLVGATRAATLPSATPRLVPDLDIRTVYPIVVRPPTAIQLEALVVLRAANPGLTVKWSLRSGAPVRLASPQPLTAASSSPAPQIASQFIAEHLALFNLSPIDVSEIAIQRQYVSAHNGVTHLALQQQVGGIKVFGAVIKVNMDAAGRILNLGGEFVPGVHAAADGSTALVTAEQARAIAVASAGFAAATQLGAAETVYFPLPDGEVLLGWELTVEDTASPDMYQVVVDAASGDVLWRHSLTRYAHGPVFTSDSPVPDTPTGTTACAPPAAYPACAEDRVDLDFDGRDFFGPLDDHYDWWNDSTGASDAATTKSNNVHAKEDQDNDNDDAEGFPSLPGAAGDFTFALDLGLDPTRENGTVQNRSSSIVNAFYWINHIHDIYYHYGFDEASGNFQSDNFGLGGSGNDPVQADVQDSAKNCNAGFSTPGDGSSPRMSLYLCSNSAPRRDSGLENLVVIHEYTHGLSHRLASFGPYHSQSGGLQDGLCDFMGLAITSEPGDDLTASYPRGQWFYNNVDGNRRQPYSTDQTVFTRTYGDLSDGARCESYVCDNSLGTLCTEDADCPAGGDCVSTACSFDADCAPPATTVNQGTCNEPPWPAGEIWCNTLWNARANLVWKHGFATGGDTAMQLAVDGLKNAPPNPDYLDMRDAILQADTINSGGLNRCILWNAFARMGMGDSASSTGDTDIHPVEAFDVPADCVADIAVTADTTFEGVCPGSSATSVLQIDNDGAGDLVVREIERIAGSADISLSPPFVVPLVIEPAGTESLTVRCAPSSCGEQNATFRIRSDDPDEGIVDLVYTCGTDETAPSFSATPADVTVECDEATDPAATGTPAASDNCGGPPDLDYADVVTPGSCPQEFTISRTWTATDTCGNSSSYLQTIDVVDTTAPVISCNAPGTIIPPDAPISFTASAVDNCDGTPVARLTGYDCWAVAGNGKILDKTQSCVVVLEGSTLSILDSGGVGDHITWTVYAEDGCGNGNTVTCEVLVERP